MNFTLISFSGREDRGGGEEGEGDVAVPDDDVAEGEEEEEEEGLSKICHGPCTMICYAYCLDQSCMPGCNL